MHSPKADNSKNLWRAAIWSLLLGIILMTGLLANRLSSPATKQDIDPLNDGLSYAIPSKWEERQRLTSPDGDLDLVIAEIDIVSEIKRVFDDGSTVTVPTRTKSSPNTPLHPNVWTCILIVPKEAPLVRTAPYPIHRRRIFTARLEGTLVLSCSPSKPLRAYWNKDREVVVESAEPPNGPTAFRLPKDGSSETISIHYRSDKPRS